MSAADNAVQLILELANQFTGNVVQIQQMVSDGYPVTPTDAVNLGFGAGALITDVSAFSVEKAVQWSNTIKLAAELGATAESITLAVRAAGGSALATAIAADLFNIYDKYTHVLPENWGHMNDPNFAALQNAAFNFLVAFSAAAFAVAFGVTFPEAALVYGLVQIFNFVLDNGYLGKAGEWVKNVAEDFEKAIKAALDPLVLDLNGDGISLVAAADGVHFDFAGDQFAELTGWVAADDGFLVIDKNGNGLIDNIGEMFGNPIQDGRESIQTGAATVDGFTALAALDGNGDGQIDAQDAQFAQLQVWQDLNQNGVTDAGELKTLTELGIVSINVQPPGGPQGGGGDIGNYGDSAFNRGYLYRIFSFETASMRRGQLAPRSAGCHGALFAESNRLGFADRIIDDSCLMQAAEDRGSEVFTMPGFDYGERCRAGRGLLRR
jgi:hypothetical protein